MRLHRVLLGSILALAGLPVVSWAVEYTGLVLPFREVVVASPVQSTIVAVSVKEGDHVETGDLLAQLHDRIEELDMRRTRAALEKREFDFEGSKNLFADQIISEDEAMKNRIELELARLQAEQAEELFQQRSIKAPIKGVVVEKMREMGESVTSAEPMFRLVDVDRVFVQFYAAVEDVAAFEVGASLQVSCRVGDAEETFAGTVDFVDPRVDAASGLVRVKVLVDNPGHRIKAGLRARVASPGTP